MKRNKRPIVALIYDFDGTLSPGNMQEFGFIQAVGFSPSEFWEESNRIASGQDASDVLSYMKQMFDAAKASGIKLRRESFREFGSMIGLFEGVREWFGMVNAYGKSKGVIVEHYINSVAVDYTAKTQFIFKINKGILSVADATLVNESWADDRKRIPFNNMIYIGDGETDVPCMKIVKMFGGHSIATYNPANRDKEATARKLFRQKRVNFMAPADYRKDAPLYGIVTRIIDKICSDNRLRRLGETE